MKKFDHFFTIILVIIVAMVYLNTSVIYAQRASAEFISSMGPTRLESGQDVKDGIQNLTYKNNILYVVNVWSGIQVIDVTSRENPKEIGTYQNEHRAHNLFIDDHYGYLSDELEGVHILDMSNPAAITKMGKIVTKGNAFWVTANYPYVYVAEEETGVSVYDISNPTSPVPIGNFDTPGWAWELILNGTTLYVSDKTGGLQILDVSDNNNLKRLGEYTGLKNLRSMSLEENYLFLADGAESVNVVDISNPKFPALVNKLVVDGYIADVFKSGKNLFMANETKKRVDIVDVSNLPEMIPGGSYQAEDKIYGLWKEDVYLFIAANTKSLILRYNSPPTLTAIADTVLNEQQMITLTVEAFDPDGDILFFEIDNMPEGAKFDTLSGTLSWTPHYEQSGIYSDIVIRVIEFTDSRLTDEKGFAITVNHVNRPPTLPEVEDYTLKEDEVLTITVMEGKDEDKEDKGKLVYSVENLPEGASFDPVSRVFTWKPTYKQSGTYMVDFVLSDQAGGLDRDGSTITIHHVDRKPLVAEVADKTINENEEISFMIEGNDPDEEDQNAISFQVIGLPEGAIFDPASQKFTWTPTYDQSGIYENLLLVMKAGNLADTTSMNITVVHINRTPNLDAVANKTVDENSKLTFTISGTDPDTEDSGNLKFSAMNLPQGANFNPDSLTFTWVPTYEQSGNFEGVTFTITDPNGLQHSQSMNVTVNHINRPPTINDIEAKTVDENVALTFVLTGSDPDQEDQTSLVYSAKQLPEGATLDGSNFAWTPGYDQSGQYTLEFTLGDGKLSESKSMTITVNHVNRPPTIETIETKTVAENQPLEFKVTANDPDTEDAGKWVLSTGQLPQGATFNAETATFSWTPSFDQAGNYSVTVTNTDPQGQMINQEVQVTVNHVNRTPVLNPIQAQTGEENVPLNVVIEAGEDPDAEDLQKIVYSAQNLPEGASFDPATRTVTWTPGYDQSGIYEIPVSMTDGEFTVTQTMSITVNHVNRPPTTEAIADQTIDENSAFTLAINATDPDQEDEGKLQVTASNLPAGMTFDAAKKELSWTPTYDQAGTYANIQFTVKDIAGLTAENTFNVTVTNINRPPEVAAIGNQTVAENSAMSVPVQGSDPDQEDQGKLQYSSDNLPTGAMLDAATGTLNWTPNFTQAGTYQINVKVADAGGLSAETTLSVTVSDVNRAPQLQPVSPKTIDEGSSLSFALAANDEDTDNSLTYTIDNLPDGATLNGSSGNFSWTPGYDQSDTYSLNAKVSDGTAESTTTVSVTVNDINRTPEISGGGSVTVTAGESASLSFSASDPDGDNLKFESNDLPAGADLNPSSGDFSWTPGDDQTGTFSFTVKVSDGKANAETTGSVTVNSKPEPPAPQQP